MPRSRCSWRPPLLALLLALPLALADAGRAVAVAGPDPRLAATIRAAHFIFAGTFEKLGASNLSLLPASGDTALVRVREIVDPPAVLGPTRGTLVTVILAQSAGAEEGGQAIFFANGALSGEHLAFSEVTRLPGRTGVPESADLQALRKQVRAVREQVADEALAARLASAALVVTGRVTEVRPAEIREGADEREHAADWWVATIAVASTEKGRPGRTATVYFAAAADPFWAAAPKLSAGEEGTFLLQPYPGVDLPAGATLLVSPSDVQPRAQLDRVHRLLPSSNANEKPQ